MLILGIETSCDDTAMAVLEVKSNKTKEIKVLTSVISSQLKTHAPYGGIVPNLAAREHSKNLKPVLECVLKETGLSMEQVNLIAVTSGPGLIPSLLVGTAFAKALAYKYNKPIIGTNHIAGHIYSNWLEPVLSKKEKTKRQKDKPALNDRKIFPILNLIVSGGHTELILMSGHDKYKRLGQTRDDAVGEAFDKVARLLGLGFPGGPAVSALADKFEAPNSKSEIKLPRPMLHDKTLDFSFSGLKTAVFYLLRDWEKAGVKLTDQLRSAVCYEFQNAVTEVLVTKTLRAAEKYKVKTIALAGGVSANKLLRQTLTEGGEKLGIKTLVPEMIYTTDNAAMIALAGYIAYLGKKEKADSSRRNSWQRVKADANWEIVWT